MEELCSLHTAHYQKGSAPEPGDISISCAGISFEKKDAVFAQWVYLFCGCGLFTLNRSLYYLSVLWFSKPNFRRISIFSNLFSGGLTMNANRLQ